MPKPYSSTINAFAEGMLSDYLKKLREELNIRIKSEEKNYLLNVDEESYKSHIVDQFYLHPLVIDKDSERILVPEKRKGSRYSEIHRAEISFEYYECTVQYQYNGSSVLFRLTPSNMVHSSYPITLNTEFSVSLSFDLKKQDAELFKQLKEKAFSYAFGNLENVNKEIKRWNDNLSSFVNGVFSATKNKHLSENEFFKAINLNVNEETFQTFTAPTIKKKVIPRPSVIGRSFSSSPKMSQEMYDDALDVLYGQGKAMSRKPSVYEGKDEESIRDYLITLLETRYERATTTGETFNKKGKTDILIKHVDGTNLFVAECKWWHGESTMNEAINQLFDNYLTWDDSKVAMLFFVKNKGFSSVLEKMKETANTHEYYLRSEGSKAESRYSYKYHLPGDPKREVQLEIMAFHFPEK